ncbi:hypothetical protein GCM10009119_12580 [Algoriphagus jejuensis]|uniref:Right handed beta helix domain-containing protein n=1 Tax=Algoriphagus jejuensis TaxID=419934 RepID=A0ABP3Y9Z5_9BACT
MAISSLQEHPGSEVTVWMADGIYPISEPLVFGPRELGEEGTLVFKAQQDAQPVISGGVEISGWIKNSEGLWEAALPKELDETSGFRELFISGKRAARARFPNEGYLRVKQAGVDRRTNFYFQKGDFPIPVNLEGVELVFLHDWSISRIGIQEIDTAADQLIAVDSIGARIPAFFTIDNWEPHPRYFLENAPEFLDADYEWIFLKSQNKVLLKLPQNVNPTNSKVSIPFSQGLIVVEGEENYPVKNIHFEGITFQYSKWEIPEKGYSGIQACHFDPRPSNEGWAVVPAAIISIWSENITFTDCNFRNLGGSGIWFGPGSKNCKIIDSSLKDIAGNGIMIGEGQDRIVNGQPWWKSAPEQVASGNVVENSTISQVGSQFYGAVGIWCGLTAQTAIKNNVLFDLPYTGISVGWMWSPEATPARENIISGNHIHEIMNILSDGGGIYLLGLQPESKVLDNRIHGVKVNAGRAESNGMFLDEGITGVLVEGNLVYDIAKSPLRFHRATTNLVRGNFFFSDDSNPPIRYNTTDEEAIEKVDNLFFSEGEPSYQKELSHAISRWEKKQRKKRKR